MNSNHSSKFLTVLLAATLVASAVAPAVAGGTSTASLPSVSAEGAPDTAEVGSQVETTFTLTDLYSEYESWTLHGETNLTAVTWTVTLYDQAGNQVGQNAYDGQSFNQSISLNQSVDEVEVVLEGTVPEVENYSYDPPQQTRLATLQQVRQGGASDAIDTWQFRPYTQDSQDAREAIGDAADAIEEAEQAGASVSGARNTLDNAISAYDSENFDLAVELASEAETSATEAREQTKQSRQRNQMLLYGGVGLLIAALIAAGIYWYQAQQDDYDKLR